MQNTVTTELSTARAKHFFVAALSDFDKVAEGKRDLLSTNNALVALQTIAAHYPQVDAVEAAQLACIYIGQNWTTANLRGCEPATILGAFMQLCSLGLVLRSAEPLAYLVGKSNKCTIFIGAKGYQLLARRNYPHVTLRTEYVTADELPNLIIKKGSIMQVEHRLNPMRTEAQAVAMYAILSLDGGKTIYDIVLMDSIEKEKYVKLHKGGVWAAWLSTMWATKLAKKIFKSLSLSDPDGSVARASLDDTTTTTIDITQVEYESEFDEYYKGVVAQLSDCQTKAEVTKLYIAFAARCRELGGGEPKQYSDIFAKKQTELA